MSKFKGFLRLQATGRSITLKFSPRCSTKGLKFDRLKNIQGKYVELSVRQLPIPKKFIKQMEKVECQSMKLN